MRPREEQPTQHRKAQGAKVLSSIQNELVRLEGEEKRLGCAITQLAERQHPLREKTEAAEQFLRTWKGIGDLLDDLPAEEKQQILQHDVEVIEFRETGATGKVGVYALQLFPEVRKFPGSDDGSSRGTLPPGPRNPETPNGIAPTWKAIPPC